MCDKYCDNLKTSNPEVEYQQFYQRKLVTNESDQYKALNSCENIKCPDFYKHNFKGYGIEKGQNNMYRTSNSEYGYYPPNAYTIPFRYYPLRQGFSDKLYRFGMFRNLTLNMSMDDI